MYGFSMDKCGYTINPVGYTPGSSFSKFSGTRNMIYIGLANAADAGYHLSEKVCKAPNLFLAIWAKSRNAHNGTEKLDLNALYCKPSYYYQTHKITVNGTDGSIIEADPVGERTNFTQDDKIIDIETFERNVGAASTDFGVNTKHFPSKAPYSMSGFEDWGLDNPTGQDLICYWIVAGEEIRRL